MSTFLQLASRLRQEVGGSGTGPTAVTSQVGEYARFVSWIATADEDVQRLHNEWKFMVGTFSLDTVAADNSYAASDCITPVTDLRDWKQETLKIYQTSTDDETKLYWMDYQEWYEIYGTGTQSQNRPSRWTVGNDRSIKLGPTPDAVYRITGEYQKSIDTLAADADTPNYPAEYHMLPVYGAMMMYGRYTGAMEIYADGEARYKRMLSEMRRTQLPRWKIAEPMA